MSDPVRSSWVDPELWPWAGRLVESGEGAQHVMEVGEGPLVLFVHGTPTWSIDWRHLVADLSRDHRCVCVDHLGFGLSERPVGVAYTPEAHAQRLDRVLAALDPRDVAVVVHDFGGPIALPWVLAHRDRVRRLVVVNSWAWPFTEPSMRLGARVMGSALGRFLYRWFNLSLRVITPSAWGDRTRLTDRLFGQLLAPFEDRQARVDVLWALAASLLGSEAHYAGLRDRLGQLADLPVDLVWGMKDHAFGPAALRRWQQHLPHAAALELPDAGHWPHEERPDDVIRFLRERGI